MIAGTLEIQLLANLARLQKDMDSARQTVGGAMTSIEQMAGRATTAFRGLLGVLGARELIGMTDQYTKFTAQLKLATNSAREYAAAYADVKRISTGAQAEMGTVGVLYARIANGTRELGIAQSRVADITETVNLALKVSGASAQESASAQLQLSQAFASGTLRGEEFNAVNEAAPRLMKALADGMGVPVGALREMASDGLITSKIMADVLPRALESLREEGKQIQTIGGAFTVLKGNVMEFVGTQANASGVVNVLTSSIGLLGTNLGLIAGTIATVMATKLITWLADSTKRTLEDVVASRAKAVATLDAARADVTATGAASSLAASRVAELRAAVAAAQGNVALAVATNGLIPAQTRATAAAAAHTIALEAQALAVKGTSVSTGLASGAMGLLGGPIGVITLLLGLGATAWLKWGTDAKQSALTAKESVHESTAAMIKQLDVQIQRHERIIELRKTGLSLDGATKKEAQTAEFQKLSKELADINAVNGSQVQLSEKQRQLNRERVLKDIVDLQKRIATEEEKGAQASAISQGEARLKFMQPYLKKEEQLQAKLAVARKQFGGVMTADDEARIRAQFAEPKAKGAAVTDSAGMRMLQSLREQESVIRAQIEGEDKLTAAEREQLKFQQLIADLKTKKILTADQKSLLADQGKLAAQLSVNIAAEKALTTKEKEVEEQKKIALALDDTRAKVDGIVRSMSMGLASQQEQYDRTLSVMGMGSQKAEETQSTKTLYREHARYQRQLNEEAAKNGTLNSEAYADGTAKIRTGLEAALGENRNYYQRLTEMRGSWELGASEGLANYYDQSRNVFAQTEALVVDAFRGMEDAAVSFAMTGKADVKSMVNSIIADLVRIQTRQMFGKVASNAGGFLGSIGNLFLPSAANPGAGANGFVDFSAASLANMGIPSFDVGTDFVPQDMIAKIHRGERILTSSENRALNSGRGTAPNVNLSVSIVKGESDRVEVRQSPDGSGIEVLVNAVKDSIANDIGYGTGSVNSAIQNRFALSPAI